METYAISLFIILLVLEIAVSILLRKKNYSLKETLENLGTGIISLVFDYGFSFMSMPLLLFLYKDLELFHWEKNFFYYCSAFIALDLTEYWFHRLSHTVPLMWTGHKVHHQSKHFNLSVGLRTSVLIPFFNIGFYCILPVLGFDPKDIVTFIFIQGVYQLFIHTEAVPKLGFLDKIFVTPSVHRVHHGKNECYLDKNFGKIFVIWDMLFKSYAPEDEKVIYGATDDEGEEGIINCQLVPVRKWARKKRG
jgi:sterol desaturase/sphingolipid hydroxylase (fatty acid hydroxylase superfamily)